MAKSVKSSDSKTAAVALTFTSPSYDEDIYGEVSRRAKLVDLRTLSSNFSVKAECIRDLEEGVEKLQHGFKGSASTFNFSPENGVVIGTVNWVAEIKSGRKKALKLDAEFLVVYTELEDLAEEYVKLYFKKIARFATYPYFRALFSGQTASAGIMLAPLPALTDRVD